MIRTRSSWVRGLSAALALAVGLVALPSMAAESPASPQSRPLATATATKLAHLEPAPATVFAQAAPAIASDESKPFLKSTKGVIAITVLTGGFAWVVISRNKDAVHSPARN